MSQSPPQPAVQTLQRREHGIPAMLKVRIQADLFETLVDDDLWPLPR